MELVTAEDMLPVMLKDELRDCDRHPDWDKVNEDVRLRIWVNEFDRVGERNCEVVFFRKTVSDKASDVVAVTADDGLRDAVSLELFVWLLYAEWLCDLLRNVTDADIVDDSDRVVLTLFETDRLWFLVAVTVCCAAERDTDRVVVRVLERPGAVPEGLRVAVSVSEWDVEIVSDTEIVVVLVWFRFVKVCEAGAEIDIDTDRTLVAAECVLLVERLAERDRVRVAEAQALIVPRDRDAESEVERCCVEDGVSVRVRYMLEESDGDPVLDMLRNAVREDVTDSDTEWDKDWDCDTVWTPVIDRDRVRDVSYDREKLEVRVWEPDKELLGDLETECDTSKDIDLDDDRVPTSEKDTVRDLGTV